MKPNGEKVRLRARVAELEAEILKVRAERDKFMEMLLARPATVTLPPGGYPGSVYPFGYQPNTSDASRNFKLGVAFPGQLENMDEGTRAS